MKHKGIICGILAAICYGTNPLGALPLYDEGVNTSSILIYRFSTALIMLTVILLVKKESFKVHRKELMKLALFGFMFAISSLTFYESFKYMDVGIASTILFIYPVMVAVIMAVFFKEKVNAVTITSILMALAGIGLLYKGDVGVSLSTTGLLLVLAAALSYSLYIIDLTKSKIEISPLKLTFYAIGFCLLVLIAYSFTSPELHFQIPPSPRAWFYACWLGLVPTVLSLVLMAVAVREIGPTPTAIMGALEPLTAIVIGVVVFGEHVTPREAIGIILVLCAVTLIISWSKISHLYQKLNQSIQKHHIHHNQDSTKA